MDQCVDVQVAKGGCGAGSLAARHRGEALLLSASADEAAAAAGVGGRRHHPSCAPTGRQTRGCMLPWSRRAPLVAVLGPPRAATRAAAPPSKSARGAVLGPWGGAGPEAPARRDLLRAPLVGAAPSAFKVNLGGALSQAAAAGGGIAAGGVRLRRFPACKPHHETPCGVETLILGFQNIKRLSCVVACWATAVPAAPLSSASTPPFAAP